MDGRSRLIPARVKDARKRVAANVDQLPNALFVVVAAAVAIGMGAWWGKPGWFIGVILAVGAMSLRFLDLAALEPHHALVGTDGIEHWFRRHRRWSTFVPFARVTAARIEEGGIAVELIGGRSLFVAIDAEDDLRDVHARIERVLAARGAPGDLASALLAQEPARARVALDDGGGYRAPSIGVERAREVLEDPAADPNARLAACALLRGRVAAVDRRALLRIAEETAHPRVRVAVAELADALEDDAVPDRIRAESRAPAPRSSRATRDSE